MEYVFDFTAGTDKVYKAGTTTTTNKEEGKMNKENKQVTEVLATMFGSNKALAEELKGVEVSDKVVGAVIKRLARVMKEKGVDLTDKSAMAAYVLANQEEINLITADVMNVRAAIVMHHDLAGYEDTHAQFLSIMTTAGLFSDAHIHGMLMGFVGKGEEQKQFVLAVMRIFNRDQKAYGEYFRSAAGVKAPNKAIIKTTTYVAADSVRATGDLVEWGITKGVQVINKYIFQMASKVMEMPVGGRPEILKEHNYVKSLVRKTLTKRK